MGRSRALLLLPLPLLLAGGCDRLLGYQATSGADGGSTPDTRALDLRSDVPSPVDGVSPPELGAGDGPRADSPSPDAARDLPPPAADASVDGAVLCSAAEVSCGGTCQPGLDCSGCPSIFLCRPTRACVASCAACSDAQGTPHPIECIACDTSQNDPVGTCEANDPSGFCLDGDYSAAHRGAPAERCDCSDTKVSNCLGDHQVCLPGGGTDWCTTCGEAGQLTDGLPCRGGGTCNTALSPPRCL